MGRYRNRWLIAASAMGIHICIGSVYAWSVFTKPLIDQTGWSLKETQFTFSLAIFVLGLSAAFLGHFLEKKGPQKSGILAALFFGAGILGCGLAVNLQSVYLLYFFYGIIGGIGLGLGYITPISTLIKWFPDKPGLATGLAVMGFGFAALISSPVIVYFIEGIGIANTFFTLGTIYLLIMLGSALYLAPPPENFKSARVEETGQEKDSNYGMTAGAAIRTRKFWYLWGMFFINISCGIAIISAASPMAQEYTGMSMVAAAAMVGIMGLFNGFGRLGWAALSDKIGRATIFTTFFALQMGAFLLLPGSENKILFQLLIFLILSCYGGGFASMPAFIKDLFGTRELGVLFGYILTAWAAAGMISPLFAAWLRSVTSTYDGTLYFFAGFLFIALILSFLMHREIKGSEFGEKAQTSVQPEKIKG